MPLTFTSAFQATIAGTDYTVRQRLTLGLPAGPYSDLTRNLQQVSLGLEMTTPYPDGVRDVVGISSLGGDITLAGQVDEGDEDKTVGWLLNPDSADSPVYRASINNSTVLYELGLDTADGGELLAKFGGWVRGAEFPEGGDVVLHVADLDPGWDKTPLLEPVVTAPPYNAGLTAEYCRDRVIRAMDGEATTPALRSNPLLSVPMIRSIQPEYGSICIATPVGGWTFVQAQPKFAAGVNGSGLLVSAGGVSGATLEDHRWVMPDDVGANAFVEFDMLGLKQGTNPASGDPYQVVIVLDDTAAGAALFDAAIIITVTNAGVTVNVLGANVFGAASCTQATAINAGKHHIAVQIHWPLGSGTSFDCWIEIDGVKHTFSGVSTGGARLTTETFGTCAIDGDVDGVAVLNGFQVTGEGSAAVSSYGFVPHAVLDPSVNTLTAVPQIDKDSSPWDELQTMDAAEGGYTRRLPNGQIRFLNRNSIANQPVNTIPITPDTNLKPGLGSTLPPATAYRTVNVPFTPWRFKKNPALLWQLTDGMVGDWMVPGNTTRVFTVDLDSGTLAGTVDSSVGALGTGADPLDGTASHYLASRDPDGLKDHGNFGPVTAQLTSPSRLVITATNPTSLPAYFVVPSTYTGSLTVGDPALWISGTLVVQGTETTVTVSTGSGTNPLDVPSNPYLQNYGDAEALGEWLLTQLAYDIRDYTGLVIIPDASVEPVDVVALRGIDASLINDYARIWGWQISTAAPPPGGGTGTFEETLSVRALGPPGAALLGIEGRSELGDADAPGSGTFYLYQPA